MHAYYALWEQDRGLYIAKRLKKTFAKHRGVLTFRLSSRCMTSGTDTLRMPGQRCTTCRSVASEHASTRSSCSQWSAEKLSCIGSRMCLRQARPTALYHARMPGLQQATTAMHADSIRKNKQQAPPIGAVGPSVGAAGHRAALSRRGAHYRALYPAWRSAWSTGTLCSGAPVRPCILAVRGASRLGRACAERVSCCISH